MPRIGIITMVIDSISSTLVSKARRLQGKLFNAAINKQ